MFHTYQDYLFKYNEEDASILMTAPELAEFLGIGRNRAYDLLRNGTIKGFRIGNVWKVSREAVIQYIRKESGLIK